MGDNKIQSMLCEHEKRLRHLEDIVLSKSATASSATKERKQYGGLSGGILFLAENGFFKQPRALKEVKEELRREGYHYSNAPIAKTLSVYFTKTKKLLTRIREESNWKYVLRK